MKGYKGFAPGLVCRGKQYAEDTVFEEERASVCSCGMHFCEDPFEVLKHYPLVNSNGQMNEFAEVEALDNAVTDDNKKYCTKKLKIGAKLSFGGFVKACVDFVVEKTKVAKIGSSGYAAKIGSSGYAAKIGSSGDAAQIGSSGYAAQIGSSGDAAQIGSSGDDAKIGSSGRFAKIGSSGDAAQIGSSGDDAQIGSSGDDAKIGSSGDAAQIGSSGDDAKIGSSGDDAKIGSSGDDAKIGSSGDDAKIDCTGTNSVICCAGHGSSVKAKKGCWITLSEWKWDNETKHNVPVCVKTEYVDGERIKEDVFYVLKNGEFTEIV